MVRKNREVFKYINYGISFGLTLAITLYLLYLGGNWLDRKLGTSPLFVILGLLLAVVTVFKQLISDAKTVKTQGKTDAPKEDGEDKP